MGLGLWVSSKTNEIYLQLCELVNSAHLPVENQVNIKGLFTRSRLLKNAEYWLSCLCTSADFGGILIILQTVYFLLFVFRSFYCKL